LTFILRKHELLSQASGTSRGQEKILAGKLCEENIMS